MSIIARKFSAAPVRTAATTWMAIIDTIAPNLDSVRSALVKIEGIAASLIAEGTPEKSPITIIGKGPRLRIYCIYDEDGSTDDANESALNWDLFNGDWKIFLPTEQADLEWVQRSLDTKGEQFKAYLVGTKIPGDDDASDGQTSSQKTLSIDTSKL
ncbi:MAG: hypothetical protein EOP04_10475 [Proteobacteria bacterium]|nr:MAG: hypothetical protein EOP04_10475 [Pseudomonadota bacterium]